MQNGNRATRRELSKRRGPRGLGFERPPGVPPDPEDVECYGDNVPNYKAPAKKTPKLSYTWSADNVVEYKLIGYTLQKWLKEHAEHWLVLAEERSAKIDYGESQDDNVLMEVCASFVIDGVLCNYEANWQKDTHRIFSDKPINAIIQKFQQVLQEENPLRSQYLQFYSGRQMEFQVRPRPKVKLEDVVLEPELLEDIVDNTLGHLEYLDGANGIIFHGQPGTGKSLATQAIAAEALSRGYCAAYVAGRINYETLDGFVRNYLTPGLLILEDIDTFSESRSERQQYGFSDFLMFISGLYERNQKTVVIATTNHLKYLDNAVANRPVRFNRNYEFGLPKEREIQRLLERFFPEIEVDKDLIATCSEYGFAGSHIAEVRRTCKILEAKHGKPAASLITKAIETVRKAFYTERRTSGFM